jgi:hypothetical protein
MGPPAEGTLEPEYQKWLGSPVLPVPVVYAPCATPGLAAIRHSGWQATGNLCRDAFSQGWICRCIVRCLFCKAREFGQESYPGFLILSPCISEETTWAYFSNRQKISRAPTLVSGTISILKAMCISTQITHETADALLVDMVTKGFHSPVRRISDLL